MKKISLTIILYITLFQPVFATVEYMEVNHITREIYWGETGGFISEYIAWESVPERELNSAENHYLEKGYTKTNFPYKIELFFL